MLYPTRASNLSKFTAAAKESLAAHFLTEEDFKSLVARRGKVVDPVSECAGRVLVSELIRKEGDKWFGMGRFVV